MNSDCKRSLAGIDNGRLTSLSEGKVWAFRLPDPGRDHKRATPFGGRPGAAYWSGKATSSATRPAPFFDGSPRRPRAVRTLAAEDLRLADPAGSPAFRSRPDDAADPSARARTPAAGADRREHPAVRLGRARIQRVGGLGRACIQQAGGPKGPPLMK